MTTLVIISQMILYVCFALLFGYFILNTVPLKYRVAFEMPKKLVVYSVIGALFGGFIPALYVITFIAPRMGIMDSVITVLTVYTVGQAWLAALAIGAILLLTLTLIKNTQKIWIHLLGIILTTLLVATIAWASHASSNDFLIGFTSDFLHLLSVSIWVGILLVTSWFATSKDNWLAFIKWFTPVAILCFTTTLVSGLFLIDQMIPSYTDAWAVSYGQGLLIKHLFIIPIAFYALMNGVFVKVRIEKNEDFNPIPWARLESVLLLIIFMITAYFTQQSPPMHSISATEVSTLFKWLYSGEIVSGLTVQLTVTWYTLLFALLMLLFVVISIIAFIKKVPTWLSLLFAIAIVLCGYLTAMFSIA